MRLWRRSGRHRCPARCGWGRRTITRSAYLPAILKRFAETHPAVQVDVRCSPSGELQRSLKAGELDLTLLSDGHAPPDWPVTELWRGPLVWVTSARFSPHRQDPLPLALAAGHGCDWADAAVHALEQTGRRYRIAYTSASQIGTHAPVVAGLAVTVSTQSWLPEGLRATRPDEGLPPLPAYRDPDAEGEAAAAADDRRAGGAYPAGVQPGDAAGDGGGVATNRLVEGTVGVPLPGAFQYRGAVHPSFTCGTALCLQIKGQPDAHHMATRERAP